MTIIHRRGPQTVRRPVLFTNSNLFPDCWTPAVDEAARLHSYSAGNEEAIGIVVDGEYIRIDNVSRDPENEACITDKDTIRCLDAQVLFHSHPGGLACPSEQDMRLQYEMDIPFVIHVPRTNDIFCWGVGTAPPPLIGRAFRHGILDCYTVIRDYYLQHLSIELPHGLPRGWDWWHKGQDIYEANFQDKGFKKVPTSEARAGDAYMFKFLSPKVMHAAVITDDQMVLHHTSGSKPYDPSRISGSESRARLSRFVEYTLRYDP
jgi:proteasome lid subunit RPN8/RPN11